MCISIGLSSPPSLLSTLTLTKTYCTRTCQPIHIIALCVAVTSSSDYTLSVYVTKNISNRVQLLCPQSHTVQDDPHHYYHYSSIHPDLQSTNSLTPRNAASSLILSNEMHISAHGKGNAAADVLQDRAAARQLHVDIVLFLISNSEWINHIFRPPCLHKVVKNKHTYTRNRTGMCILRQTELC